MLNNRWPAPPSSAPHGICKLAPTFSVLQRSPSLWEQSGLLNMLNRPLPYSTSLFTNHSTRTMLRCIFFYTLLLFSSTLTTTRRHCSLKYGKGLLHWRGSIIIPVENGAHFLIIVLKEETCSLCYISPGYVSFKKQSLCSFICISKCLQY